MQTAKLLSLKISQYMILSMVVYLAIDALEFRSVWDLV